MRSQRSRPIDRASLTRQFLAAAVDRAVDAGLPQLTPVDTGLPRTANVQNEPTAVGSPPTPFVNSYKKAVTTPPTTRASTATAVDTGLHQLTPVDARLRETRTDKTNPPRRQTLSARQLAAARLLACGWSPVEVATEVGVTRQALWKWRRR